MRILRITLTLCLICISETTAQLSIDLGPEIHFTPRLETDFLRFEIGGKTYPFRALGIKVRDLDFLFGLGIGRSTPATITFDALRNFTPDKVLDSLVNSHGALRFALILEFYYPLHINSVAPIGETFIPDYPEGAGVFVRSEPTWYFFLLDSTDQAGKTSRSSYSELDLMVGLWFNISDNITRVSGGFAQNIAVDRIFTSQPYRFRLRFDFFSQKFTALVPDVKFFIMVQLDKQGPGKLQLRVASLPYVEAQPPEVAFIRLGFILNPLSFWQKK